MFGVLINALLVVLGTTLGLLLHKYLPEKVLTTIFHGMGLCVIYLGLKDALNINNTLFVIISLSFGGLIGEFIDFDTLFNKLVNKFGKNNTGFITSTILFCSGSMAIIGSLEAGLNHNYTILISKGVIDCFAAIILTSKHGKSVYLSTLSILIYQGVIALASSLLTSLVSNEILMNDLVGTGSLILLAVGLNMLEVTKIKTMNLLPSMVIIVLLHLIF